jgi:hypothetical protein
MRDSEPTLSVKQINGWDLASENTASIETAPAVLLKDQPCAPCPRAVVLSRIGYHRLAME